MNKSFILALVALICVLVFTGVSAKRPSKCKPTIRGPTKCRKGYKMLLRKTGLVFTRYCKKVVKKCKKFEIVGGPKTCPNNSYLTFVKVSGNKYKRACKASTTVKCYWRTVSRKGRKTCRQRFCSHKRGGKTVFKRRGARSCHIQFKRCKTVVSKRTAKKVCYKVKCSTTVRKTLTVRGKKTTRKVRVFVTRRSYCVKKTTQKCKTVATKVTRTNRCYKVQCGRAVRKRYCVPRTVVCKKGQRLAVVRKGKKVVRSCLTVTGPRKCRAGFRKLVKRTRNVLRRRCVKIPKTKYNVCSVTGDPHINGYCGKNLNNYRLGEWFATKGKDFSVSYRAHKWKKASVHRSVAISSYGNKVIYHSSNKSFFVNGKKIDVPLKKRIAVGSKTHIYRSSVNHFQVVRKDKIQVKVNTIDLSKRKKRYPQRTYLGTSIYLPSHLKGFKGECGENVRRHKRNRCSGAAIIRSRGVFKRVTKVVKVGNTRWTSKKLKTRAITSCRTLYYSRLNKCRRGFASLRKSYYNNCISDFKRSGSFKEGWNLASRSKTEFNKRIRLSQKLSKKNGRHIRNAKGKQRRAKAKKRAL